MLIGFGEKFDDQRPPVDGHVRGEMHLGGYLLTATPTGTLMNYVVKLDLKGSIPGTIVNLVSNSQPMILLTLRNLMNKAKSAGAITNPVDKRSTYSELVTYMSDELYKSCGGAASGGTAPATGAAAATASKVGAKSAGGAGAGVGRGSSLLKMAAKTPHINGVALLILFLPPLLYYVLEGYVYLAD